MSNAIKAPKQTVKNTGQFVSKYLPKHEIWILPMLTLIGIFDGNYPTVDLWSLSQTLTPVDPGEDYLIHEKIHEALIKYSKYVSEGESEEFLAVLTTGDSFLSSYNDEHENLEWFYDNPFSDRYILDELAICKFLFLGRHAKDWYSKTDKVFKKTLKGYDLVLFKKIFAITSIRAHYKSHMTLALKAYKQYQKGEPFVGFFPNAMFMLNDLRAGTFLSEKDTDNNSLIGVRRKISNFYKALSGDKNVVVVDDRVTEACGLKEYNKHKGKKVTARPEKTKYNFIEEYIRTLAKVTGYEPTEITSMLWAGVKSVSSVYQEVDTELLLKNSLAKFL